MEDKTKIKELVEKYPFLLPRNVFTDKLDPEYDYSYTWLSDMPKGWKNVFAEKLCEELKEELVKNNLLDDFRITTVKEKYGTLRIYTNFTTDKISEIIRNYEDLSMLHCPYCGKKTKYVSLGYVLYLCEDCASRFPYQCEKLTIHDIPYYNIYKKDSCKRIESIHKAEMEAVWK